MIHIISSRIVSLIVVLLLSQFLFLALAHGQQPVPVIVTEAKVDTMVDRVEALGTLRANESVALTAAITDTITRINFDDGQRVETGDILAEMTSAEEHAQLEEEFSTLQEARKQLERVEQLVEQKAAPQTLLDQRRRDHQTAQARLRQVESKLQDRLILAPFSGVVGLRNISVGALVEPGDVITTLDDDSVMKLDFSVPATFLESLSPGLAIEARTAGHAGRNYEGVISSIDSRVDVATRSITARALLDNRDRSLKPGMLMSVELLNNSRESVIIPEAAVIPLGNSMFVYRINRSSDPYIAEKIGVTVGGRRVGEVEILKGLAPGDMVVVHGGLRIRPGAAVTIQAVDDGSKSLSQMLGQDGGGKQ